MLNKRTRRQFSAAALLVAAFAFLPGASRAATAYCLNAFGNGQPSAYDPASGETHNVFCGAGWTGTLTPLDAPNGQSVNPHFTYKTGNANPGKLGGPNKGDLIIHGIAAPGASVRVEVTDGINTIWRKVTATASDDSGAGKPAGSYEFVFGAGHFYDPSGDGVKQCANDVVGQPPRNCPWMVGVSDLGVHSGTPGSALSTDAATRGPSTLNVSATWTGGSASTTVTKYAATYKDTTVPSLGGECGGTNDKVHPCSVPTNWYHRDSFFGGTTANPEAVIYGFAFDDGSNAWGKGSEIADVILTVKQGTQLLMQRSIMSGRQGPVARWRYVANINDYEPNCLEPIGILPCGEPYHFDVDVIDAWGNTSSYSSGDVYVNPS